MKKKDTIFLVEDDEEDVEFFKEALSHSTFDGELVAVKSGEALMNAVHSAEKNNLPDVILLDLNMPLKDGFQALAELRSNSRFTDIPVMILTASSRKDDELRCYSLGCDRFFRKPFAFDEYRLIIDHILETLRSRAVS
jgi:CheY-like chemotaxis protein